ncbi:MAG: glycosyltransferase family 4 protein [Planctomycetota bacterium]
MNLLYLMTEAFDTGGVQSDLVTLSRLFSREGVRVTVASPPGVRIPDLAAAGASHAPIDAAFRFFWGLRRLERQIAEIIFREKPDILAPQSVRTTLAAGRARQRIAKRIPLVTTIHNIHFKLHFRTAPMVLNRYADFVIFESHYERNRLVANGLVAEKSAVVPSGIDLERFSPRPKDAGLLARLGIPAEAPVIGCVARLSSEKGLFSLLEAFSQIHRERPEARLILVGDGPLETLLRNRAETLRLASRVIFAGNQNDIPTWLSIFDIFALSSTRESFPLSAREAMACGKPVVLTDVGGCAEVIGNSGGGLLVPPDRPGETARAILSLLADSERMTRMSREARRRAESCFDQTAWAQGDLKIYRNTISHTTPPS